MSKIPYRAPYPSEFRREAVELVRTSGRPGREIARELGVSLRSDLEAELVVDALEMAVARRKPAAGLVHHFDQGSQYVSLRWKSLSDRCEQRTINPIRRAKLQVTARRRNGPTVFRQAQRRRRYDHRERFSGRIHENDSIH